MSILDGRGRWYRWHKKDTTEDCLNLDMRRFSELVDLTSTRLGSWVWTLSNHFGESKITIGAQLYLKKFYESHGFVQTSEMYLEDDIPHIQMEKSR